MNIASSKGKSSGSSNNGPDGGLPGALLAAERELAVVPELKAQIAQLEGQIERTAAVVTRQNQHIEDLERRLTEAHSNRVLRRHSAYVFRQHAKRVVLEHPVGGKLARGARKAKQRVLDR